MRFSALLVLAALTAASLTIPALEASAGGRRPHPVVGWGGDRFLFEVEPQGNRAATSQSLVDKCAGGLCPRAPCKLCLGHIATAP